MEAQCFLHPILAAFTVIFILSHVAGTVFITAFVLNHAAFIAAFVLDHVAGAAFFVLSGKEAFILSSKKVFFVCFIFAAGGCSGK
ncbi:hypothetical protein H1R20_g1316, partial [Candolleomyces eurysporus]